MRDQKSAHVSSGNEHNNLMLAKRWNSNRLTSTSACIKLMWTHFYKNLKYELVSALIDLYQINAGELPDYITGLSTCPSSKTY